MRKQAVYIILHTGVPCVLCRALFTDNHRADGLSDGAPSLYCPASCAGPVVFVLLGPSYDIIEALKKPLTGKRIYLWL